MSPSNSLAFPYFCRSVRCSTDQATPTSAAPTIANHRPESHGVRYKALNEPITEATRKRGREEEGLQEQRKQRLANGGMREHGLLQRREPSPSDAQPISVVPSYWDRPTEDLRQTSKMPSKIGKSSIHPINTLNQRPYASQENISSQRTDVAVSRLAAPEMKDRSVRDLSKYSTKTTAQHFDYHNDREAKRRKGRNGTALPASRPSNTVDLTEDDSQPAYPSTKDVFGKPVGRSTGRASQGSSGLSVTSQDRRASRPDTTIARKTSAYTEIAPQKRRRRSKEAARSAQTSERASPANISPLPVACRGTSSRSPAVEVYDDEILDPLQYGKVKMNDPSSLTSIAKSGDQSSSPKRSPSRIADPSQSNDMLRGGLGFPPSNSRAVGLKQSVQHDSTRTLTRSVDQSQSDDVFASLVSDARGQAQPQEQHLRNKFKRDAPDEAAQPRTKEAKRDLANIADQPNDRAPQRMKAASNAPSESAHGRSSIGSIDELTRAEVTVGRRAARNPAPPHDHMSIAATSPQQKVLADENQVAPSPSTSRPVPRGVQTARPTRSATLGELRIRVSRLLCRACCLDEGEIELVWDKDMNSFSVELNGTPQPVCWKEKATYIGPAEVDRLEYALPEEMLTVYLRGPISDVSNGKMLITFADVDGLTMFRDSLFKADRSSVVVGDVPGRKIEGYLKHLSFELISDHKKHQLRLPSHDDAQIALLQQKKSTRVRARAPSEERIRYEPESPAHPSARSRMQARDSDAAAPPNTESKYFASTTNENRKSLRHSNPVKTRSSPPPPPPPKRWTHENKLEPWSHSVVYPPEGSTRRVTIDYQDIERLDEGEFLNDNIISFALRQIEERMKPAHKEKVHFFNSFFYAALTRQHGKRGIEYDAVKRWTKNKDLFDIPYIVVPMNLDLHWYVAIICNLDNLSRKAAGLDLEVDESLEMLDDLPRSSVERTLDLEIAVGTDNAQESMEHLSLSDGGNRLSPSKIDSGPAVPAEDENEPTSSRPTTAEGKRPKKKGAPPARKYDPDVPTIITLDSFGSTHAVEIRNLKDYLNAEAEEKRGMEVGAKDLQGLTAKGLPEQTNFCDCGVYLVGYIEEFAKDPRKFVTKVLQKELDKQTDFVHFNPSAKRAEIREELLKLHEQQDAERKAKKLAKKAASSAAAESGVSTSAAAPLLTPDEPAADKGPGSSKSGRSSEVAHIIKDTKHRAAGIRDREFPPSERDAASDELPMDVPRPLQPRSSVLNASSPSTANFRPTEVHQMEGQVDSEDVGMSGRATKASSPTGSPPHRGPAGLQAPPSSSSQLRSSPSLRKIPVQGPAVHSEAGDGRQRSEHRAIGAPEAR